MSQLQFFLFGLFLIWFASTGKLRGLWTALRSQPAPANKASSGTGNLLDPNNPRNIITGDPFGLGLNPP